MHRDADSKGLKARRQEIQDACVGIFDPEAVIPVVPVKMLETWLLVDMTAISRWQEKLATVRSVAYLQLKLWRTSSIVKAPARCIM